MISKRQQKANRKKWIAALESGKYEQGKSALACGGKFCCLGVLVEAVAPELWQNPAELNMVSYDKVLYGVDPDDLGDQEPHIHAGTLIREAAELVGLRSGSGMFHVYGRDDYDSLVSQNDSGTGFKEIAAIIRSEPDGLFTS